MTFEQIIERANAAAPNAKFHVFIEYADGRRGYAKSFTDFDAANRFYRSQDHAGNEPLMYDRDGNDVD